MRWTGLESEIPAAMRPGSAGDALARLLASGRLGERLIDAAHAGAARERAAIALGEASDAPALAAGPGARS